MQTQLNIILYIYIIVHFIITIIMMDTITPANNQIIHLVSAISEADDYSIPSLLLQVKGMMIYKLYVF